MKLTYTVTPQDTYTCIKDIALSHFHLSHRLLTKLKKENAFFLNERPCTVSTKVSSNDNIIISFDYIEENENIVPTAMPISIVDEDDAYLVINKPAGIPVHPSILHYQDSLSNGVRHYFDTIGLKKKIRPVNRIDKDTSGLVIFAKNEYVQESLIRQMGTKHFKKEYIAIVEGHFDDTAKKRNN